MKNTPIPKELWGALCVISGEVTDVLKHATENDFENDVDFIRLTESLELLTEFILCHGADGRVSQRGEVPQCWNDETIWTPHRKFHKDDNKQLLFDWSEPVPEPNMIKCPICSGKGYRQRTDKKTDRKYICEVCEGEKEIESYFAKTAKAAVGPKTEEKSNA